MPSYTTTEAARLLGIKANTFHVRAMRRRKRSPGFGRRVGPIWTYTEAEVRKIANTRQSSSTLDKGGTQ